MKLVLLLAFGSLFMVACAAPDEIVVAKSPVTDVAAPAPANAVAPQPVATNEK
ncbi:MAG: hypothetical protein ABI183_02680 [Polyangiaceae bacterium]